MSKSDQIVNRVAQSALVVFDLEDYYPENPILELDLADFLDQGFVLREKEFRKALEDFNWEVYNDSLVSVYCSTDAIIPIWAKALLSSYLNAQCRHFVFGSKTALISSYYNNILIGINFEEYREKAVILKGCSKKEVPESAYIHAMGKLQEVAKKIMYGEACSAVPLYKHK